MGMILTTRWEDTGVFSCRCVGTLAHPSVLEKTRTGRARSLLPAPHGGAPVAPTHPGKDAEPGDAHTPPTATALSFSTPHQQQHTTGDTPGHGGTK